LCGDEHGRFDAIAVHNIQAGGQPFGRVVDGMGNHRAGAVEISGDPAVPDRSVRIDELVGRDTQSSQGIARDHAKSSRRRGEIGEIPPCQVGTPPLAQERLCGR
jgi:hypothetical protein